MRITTPYRDAPVPASHEAIREIISELPGQARPAAILGGTDDLTYVQALATPAGFLLEYQEGSTEHHFEAVRSDLSADEVVEAFGAYLDGNPAWRGALEFRRTELSPPSNGIGIWLGNILGRLFR
jgi:hypothetical protein